MGVVMASVSFTHRLNDDEIRRLLTSPDGGVGRDLLRRGQRVVNRAKQLLSTDPKRVDTGRLRADVHGELLSRGGKLVYRVGTNLQYAIYVHDGTGIYGPRGTMIVPKAKKALRWKARGGGKGKNGYVFSMRSRGMRPNPFLKNALPAARG